MAPKELPNDRDALKHLLQCVDCYLKSIEPIDQQAQQLVRGGVELISGDLTHSEFHQTLQKALLQSLVDGIPGRTAIDDYLDLADLDPAIDVHDAERDSLALLVREGKANEVETKRYLNLMMLRSAAFGGGINAVTIRVADLYRRILEKLETVGGIAGEKSRVSGLGEAPGHVGESESPRASEQGAPAPSTLLDEVAIALNENGWQVFRRFHDVWRHSGTMKPEPKNGYEKDLLKLFLESKNDRVLRDIDLINGLLGRVTRIEGAQAYRKKIVPAVSRLRTSLRDALNLPKVANPIRRERKTRSFRFTVEIGYAVQDERERLQFSKTGQLES